MDVSPRRNIALGYLIAALTLSVLVQVTPWATLNAEVATVTASAQAGTYQASFQASGFGRTTSETRSWFNATFDDQSGIAQVRGAIPFAALTPLALAAGLVLALRRNRTGSVVALTSAIVLASIAAILMTSGLNDLFDGQQEWAAAMWFTWLAALLAAASGLLLFLDRATGSGDLDFVTSPLPPTPPAPSNEAPERSWLLDSEPERASQAPRAAVPAVRRAPVPRGSDAVAIPIKPKKKA
ncbi:MAG: hypothetical protein AABX89_07895 [Candidatus Thermoplasmatota archaeon]